MMRTMAVSLFIAFAILLAGGAVMAGEDCGNAGKSSETTTKADPPKPLTASTK